MTTRTLAASRDGARVAELAGDRLRIIELGQGTSQIAPASDARHLALFESELWVVDGPTPTLRRLTHDLRETQTLELPDGHGLVRSIFGPPAALWLTETPRVLASEGAELRVSPLEIPAVEPHEVAMLSAQRFVIAHAGALALHDGSTVRWRLDLGSGRALAIGSILDGRFVVALVERPDGDPPQHLIVLAARDGRLHHRLALRGITGAWFAAHRGIAALTEGPHRIVLVDLRFGRVLCQHAEERTVAALALDDAGEHLVVHLTGDAVDDDELVALPVRGLIAGLAPPSASEAVDADAAPAAPAVEPAPAQTIESAQPPPSELAAEPAHMAAGALVVPPLLGLRPVAASPRATRDEAIALLEQYRRYITALAGHAITSGWDTGRISFVDEARPPFEREVAAAVLDVRGLAQAQVQATATTLLAAQDALDAAERGLADREPPLAALAAELCLSPLAQHLLLLVAAPTLWGRLARLYGIIANDENRALCDELLLTELLSTELARPRADAHAIARELDCDQPLVRHGLIRIATERARPFAALSVDPLVLKLLRADPLDTDLDAGTRVVAATRSLDALRISRSALAAAITALAQPERDGPARLVLRGRRGSGRRTVAAALAAHAGRMLAAIDASRLLRERRLDQLGLQLRRCALRGWIPIVEGLEAISADDPTTRDQVRDVLREHAGPLAVRLLRGTDPPLDPGYVLLDLAPSTIAERAEHWHDVLDGHGLVVRDVDELATRFAIGPGMIERVAAQVAGEHRDRPEPAPAHADRAIDAAVRQHLASALGQVATRITRLANWSQVILPADILDSVLELISRIRRRRVVYDTWGFDRLMSTSRGVTALFQGGPGTGKTLVASAIANELDLDLYRIDLSRVMSKWIGETEQNLARVFDAAEEAQAILLFDEADSLFARRTEVRSSVDRYANLEVNYLLQRLDSFEGIAFLTTNFGTAIDTAFKRRLSFRLTFPFPDDETREQLWRAHIPEQLPRGGPLDLAALARRYRMSGGYIRNAALRAAFLAAEERSALTQDHLERAIRAEFREIGKLAETGMLE